MGCTDSVGDSRCYKPRCAIEEWYYGRPLLAVRPHIGQRLEQQPYDALRREFEAQHGELLHPGGQPLADIRFKAAVERR